MSSFNDRVAQRLKSTFGPELDKIFTKHGLRLLQWKDTQTFGTTTHIHGVMDPPTFLFQISAHLNSEETKLITKFALTYKLEKEKLDDWQVSTIKQKLRKNNIKTFVDIPGEIYVELTGPHDTKMKDLDKVLSIFNDTDLDVDTLELESMNKEDINVDQLVIESDEKEEKGTGKQKPIATQLAESLQDLLHDTMIRSKTKWDFPKIAEEDPADTTQDTTAYKYFIAIDGKRGPLADVNCYVKLSAPDKTMKVSFDVISREKLFEPQLQILKQRAEDAVGTGSVFMGADNTIQVKVAIQNPLDKKLLAIAAVLLEWNKDLPEGTEHDIVKYTFENRQQLKAFVQEVASNIVRKSLNG